VIDATARCRNVVELARARTCGSMESLREANRERWSEVMRALADRERILRGGEA